MHIFPVMVPPIKIQGIKTKLVPLIDKCRPSNATGQWIEPFMGSGVVGFNLAGDRAIFSDINPHTIDFYSKIKQGVITPQIVRAYLEDAAPKLKSLGVDYYYEVRERFNSKHSPLDFLFLNRSCFNGMIRFNRKGEFNVPFGHKPERFIKPYITKIVNQVDCIYKRLLISDWQFVCQSFEQAILQASCDDFIYCDPPYIGRHVDYYDSWDEKFERQLHDSLMKSGCKFMVSTWHHNQYRTNSFIESLWSDCNYITQEHFYHVGAKEKNRNPMVEALLFNYDTDNSTCIFPVPCHLQDEFNF